MAIVRVSDRGRVTLPALLRRAPGIALGARMTVLEREGELVLTPLRSIREVEGVFRDYARPAPVGWDAERAKAQKAVAREAAGE